MFSEKNKKKAQIEYFLNYLMRNHANEVPHGGEIVTNKFLIYNQYDEQFSQ